MRIHGFLLDLDGTLLDSRAAHARVWQRTLAAHDIVKEESEIVFDFAAPDPQVVVDLFGVDDPQVIDAIAQEKNDYFLEELPQIPLFPRVPDVLAQIHAFGDPICFVSSNYDRVLARMVEIYGWEEIGATFVGIDGVVRAKPDPEMVVKALGTIDREAAECVTIGDSPADILAGQAAGTHTIAVCSGGTPRADLTLLTPDLIFENIGDLLALLPLELD